MRALRELLLRILRGVLQQQLRQRGGTRRSPSRRRTGTGTGRRRRTPPGGASVQDRRLVYAPDLDGRADPGEVVWTWVAYEEDPTRGKDRPVLVVGRDDRTLLALMLSSNADRDGQRDWLALGSGAWDGEHRPSWIRLDRVLRLPDDTVRREGAVLSRSRFDAVADRLRASYGWS